MGMVAEDPIRLVEGRRAVCDGGEFSSLLCALYEWSVSIEDVEMAYCTLLVYVKSCSRDDGDCGLELGNRITVNSLRVLSKQSVFISYHGSKPPVNQADQ